MKPTGKTEPLSGAAAATPSTTLRDVVEAVEGLQGLSITRRRDLRSESTGSRLCSMMTLAGSRSIYRDRRQVAAISPVAAGLSIESFSNVKLNLMAAVKATN